MEFQLFMQLFLILFHQCPCFSLWSINEMEVYTPIADSLRRNKAIFIKILFYPQKKHGASAEARGWRGCFRGSRPGASSTKWPLLICTDPPLQMTWGSWGAGGGGRAGEHQPCPPGSRQAAPWGHGGGWARDRRWDFLLFAFAM